MEEYFEESTILGQAREIISTYVVPFRTSQESVAHLKINFFQQQR